MIVFLQTDRRTATGEVLPLHPLLARWIEAVNGGARFRFDPADCLEGPQGGAHLRLPLALTQSEGYPFGEIALYLYNRNLGALLCHPDGDVSEGSDHFPISYGDVVDYLQTGELLDRVPCTPPWGYPTGATSEPAWIAERKIELVRPELLVGPAEEPDLLTLPHGVRCHMDWWLRRCRAEESGVSLFRSPEGVQLLYIVYRLAADLSPSPQEYQMLANRLIWHLPRYYAAIILPTQNVQGYPLLPEER